MHCEVLERGLGHPLQYLGTSIQSYLVYGGFCYSLLFICLFFLISYFHFRPWYIHPSCVDFRQATYSALTGVRRGLGLETMY